MLPSIAAPEAEEIIQLATIAFIAETNSSVLLKIHVAEQSFLSAIEQIRNLRVIVEETQADRTLTQRAFIQKKHLARTWMYT